MLVVALVDGRAAREQLIDDGRVVVERRNVQRREAVLLGRREQLDRDAPPRPAGRRRALRAATGRGGRLALAHAHVEQRAHRNLASLKARKLEHVEAAVVARCRIRLRALNQHLQDLSCFKFALRICKEQ